MFRIKNIKAVRIIKHIIYWLCFFTALFVFMGFEALNKNFLIIDLPVTLFYSYFIAYFIIPYFLRKGQIIVLLLSIVIISLLLSFIRLSNYDYVYYALFSSSLSNHPQQLSFPLLVLNAKDFSLGLLLFLSVKYTNAWIHSDNKLIRIEKEQLVTEMKLIKTQVDPHFLFNTMNNFYSLSVSKNKQIQSKIGKMWGLMDFMVTETHFKEIKLTKEIKLIQDYIDLEKLRYGKRLNLSFVISGELEDYRIPPLILYPFIENCFKHGCAPDPGNSWLEIKIEELKDKIRFTIINSITENSDTKLKNKDENGGIENIRNRLNYQLSDRFNLDIENRVTEFYVKLEIFY